LALASSMAIFDARRHRFRATRPACPVHRRRWSPPFGRRRAACSGLRSACRGTAAAWLIAVLGSRQPLVERFESGIAGNRLGALVEPVDAGLQGRHLLLQFGRQVAMIAQHPIGASPDHHGRGGTAEEAERQPAPARLGCSRAARCLLTIGRRLCRFGARRFGCPAPVAVSLRCAFRSSTGGSRRRSRLGVGSSGRMPLGGAATCRRFASNFPFHGSWALPCCVPFGAAPRIGEPSQPAKTIPPIKFVRRG